MEDFSKIKGAYFFSRRLFDSSGLDVDTKAPNREDRWVAVAKCNGGENHYNGIE